jgi:hypothetical protein
MIARPGLGIIIAMLCIACSDSTGPDATHVGVYHLRTVNGDALPFTLAQVGADRVEVASGYIVLNADGTFTDRTTFRIVEAAGEQVTDETATGTYTTNGSVVQLAPTGADRYSVAIRDNRVLTQTMETLVLVYTK